MGTSTCRMCGFRQERVGNVLHGHVSASLFHCHICWCKRALRIARCLFKVGQAPLKILYCEHGSRRRPICNQWHLFAAYSSCCKLSAEARGHLRGCKLDCNSTACVARCDLVFVLA